MHIQLYYNRAGGGGGLSRPRRETRVGNALGRLELSSGQVRREWDGFESWQNEPWQEMFSETVMPRGLGELQTFQEGSLDFLPLSSYTVQPLARGQRGRDSLFPFIQPILSSCSSTPSLMAANSEGEPAPFVLLPSAKQEEATSGPGPYLTLSARQTSKPPSVRSLCQMGDSGVMGK